MVGTANPFDAGVANLLLIAPNMLVNIFLGADCNAADAPLVFTSSLLGIKPCCCSISPCLAPAILTDDDLGA